MEEKVWRKFWCCLFSTANGEQMKLNIGLISGVGIWSKECQSSLSKGSSVQRAWAIGSEFVAQKSELFQLIVKLCLCKILHLYIYVLFLMKFLIFGRTLSLIWAMHMKCPLMMTLLVMCWGMNLLIFKINMEYFFRMPSFSYGVANV